MNKIIPILLTLLLLMLILNHAEYESKPEVEKKLFKELSGKVKYGDGKPTLTPLLAPLGKLRDYPGDEPSTAPPPDTPIWCPRPEEGYGPPPPYPEADECVY
jgi:hypothetical protein